MTIPYVFFGYKILLINASMFLYNIGVLSFVLLYFATFNKKRIDLTRGGAFNYQGIGAMNWLAVLPAFLLPILIYVPFNFAGLPNTGIAFIGFLGVLGLFFTRFLSASYSGVFIKESISWQLLSEKDLRILKVNHNDTNKQLDQSIWYPDRSGYPGSENRKGESFGLVGNNGAGKTTMFRCVLDLIRTTTGTVLSKGVDVAKKENWKHYTGSYLDDGFLIDFLTPEEYFQFIADVYGLSEGDVAAFYTEFEDFFNKEVLGKRS